HTERPGGPSVTAGEQASYSAGGGGTPRAEPLAAPAITVFSQLTDAIFEPLAARQQVIGVRLNASATANQVLLEVAQLHFELTAAEAVLGYRRETAAEGAEVARLTRAYAQAAQGRPADAERAATELSLIDQEVRRAEEEVAVAATRLTRRLHLDQSVRLRPLGPGLTPLTLIDPSSPLPALVQTAARRRGEVGARDAAVAAAEARHRQEKFRPLLPTVWLGYSGGVFGGGSNLIPPLVGNFRGRTDLDVRAFWTLSNLGAGNVALMRRRWAE